MNHDEDPKLDLSAQGIWQRLASESVTSYTAFCAYLELGADATLQQVADQSGKSLDAVCKLSARHHWMERAAAYRQHVDTALVAAQRERAKQAEFSHMRDYIFRRGVREASQNLLMTCRQALNQLRLDPTARFAPYELAGLFNLGFKLGCRANEPTGFTSDGPAPASPDFDAAVEKVYGENMGLEQLIELMKTLPRAHHPAPSDAEPPQARRN